MNAVEDKDIELLETYLDDQLAADEARDLAACLVAEPALAGELEELRKQRAMCHGFFASLEGDDDLAERLLAKVTAASASTARRQWFASHLSSVRWISAAAACLIVGFGAGMLAYHLRQPAPVDPTQTKVVTVYELKLSDVDGRVIAVQKFDSMEDAQRFSAELAAYQERQKAARTVTAVLSRDRF